MDALPTIKIDVTATKSLLADLDDHRRWLVDITWITPDGIDRISPEADVEIVDPFTIDEYQKYERSQHPASQSASLRLGEDSGLTEDFSTQVAISEGEQSRSSRWDRSSSGRDQYRYQLHVLLKLDMVSQHGFMVKINIIEDFHIQSEDPENCYSIHSLLWELLEENTDIDIQVTRWITGTKTQENLPRGLSQSNEPLRILLIIARDLKYTNGRHSDPESVAYDILYAMAKFFGPSGRLSIEVVRPGTFSELERHLERRKQYDLVHIDVHGVVKRLPDPTLDYSPELCFGHCKTTSLNNTDSPDDEQCLDHRTTEEVANLLRDYGITVVVLSACLSSFGQGKPLSNMCRVFASFGMCAVTGMNFSVKATSAKAYYLGFYQALVLSKQSFRNAAVHGRRTLHSHLSSKKKKASRQGQSSSQASSRTPSMPGSIQSRQQYNMHDEWPTATTYFAMNRFDRTNSIELMGETSSKAASGPVTAESDMPDRQRAFYCFITALIMSITHLLKRALLKAPPLARLKHLVVMAGKDTPTGVEEEIDPCTAFMTFQRGPETSQLKHSVGLMVLEHELKRLRKLYVQVTNVAWPSKARQNQCIRDLQDQWRVTNFADKVEVVPASTFESFPKYLYRLSRSNLSRWCTNLKTWWRGRDSPTTILIITEIEAIIHGDEPSHLPAINRMSRYIRATEAGHPDRSYLIITSHGGVDWPGITLDRQRYDWVEASHFFARVGFSTVQQVL
ncbi:hypothetical protein ACHAPT_011933 [Fusarium lateritium]